MQHIRAIALDVDGVLTDGALWWGSSGEEFKRFSFADIMGVSLALKAGLLVTLISGEDSPLVARYAQKMKLLDVTAGCKDKAGALTAYAERNNVALSEIAFMGDDVNDLSAMALAGLAAAPADARQPVLAAATFVSRYPGGGGAVRELVDSLLALRGVPDLVKGSYS